MKLDWGTAGPWCWVASHGPIKFSITRNSPSEAKWYPHVWFAADEHYDDWGDFTGEPRATPDEAKEAAEELGAEILTKRVNEYESALMALARSAGEKFDRGARLDAASRRPVDYTNDPGWPTPEQAGWPEKVTCWTPKTEVSCGQDPAFVTLIKWRESMTDHWGEDAVFTVHNTLADQERVDPRLPPDLMPAFEAFRKLDENDQFAIIRSVLDVPEDSDHRYD